MRHLGWDKTETTEWAHAAHVRSLPSGTRHGHATRRRPARPERGHLFFWDSESTGIFIDHWQAALNGTRPNSPEGVKPATAPSLRALLSIQKHPERHSAQFSRDAEPATLNAQKGARLVGPRRRARRAGRTSPSCPLPWGCSRSEEHSALKYRHPIGRMQLQNKALQPA